MATRTLTDLIVVNDGVLSSQRAVLCDGHDYLAWLSGEACGFSGKKNDGFSSSFSAPLRESSSREKTPVLERNPAWAFYR